MVDYDGTLAPFRINRNEAFPYPGVQERLKRLASGNKTRLVIVTGRMPDDVDRLLDLNQPVELFACHGAIHRFPNGRVETMPVSSNAAELLGQIRDWGVAKNLGERMEWKQVSLAFHWRGMPQTKANQLRDGIERQWSDRITECELVFLPFDGGIELRIKGMHKGIAVRSIINDTNTDAPIAYLGDDLTDEDAFRELGQKGLKVLVRSETRTTLADLRLTPPGELLEFLDRWSSESDG